ncbi:MAG TPA: DUF4383 domain-containing protein [Thermodesulfobacteriota bacterium]
MQTRYFALVAGLVYALAGIAGFVPAFRTALNGAAPALAIDTGAGRLFGLFPINVLHNLVHLGLGIWGLAAYARYSAARTFSRGLAWILGVLAVMGFFPGLNTLFGLTPLFDHDIWLHGATALIAAYFGYRTPEVVEARPGVAGGRRDRQAA